MPIAKSHFLARGDQVIIDNTKSLPPSFQKYIGAVGTISGFGRASEVYVKLPQVQFPLGYLFYLDELSLYEEEPEDYEICL